MSAKKKSYGVLFTPYLEKGEDLIWVGAPEKNSLLTLGSKTRLIDFWLVILFPLLLTICIIASVSGLQADLRNAGEIAISGISVLLAWGAGFFLFGFVRIGKNYYAITTKRLFLLRRHLWNSLDVDSLMLLPEHRLENNDDGTISICFAPRRIDEIRFKGKYYRSGRWWHYDYLTREEFYRANLENLSSEDAPTAFQLLTAAKNDVLDKHARNLGLME